MSIPVELAALEGVDGRMTMDGLARVFLWGGKADGWVKNMRTPGVGLMELESAVVEKPRFGKPRFVMNGKNGTISIRIRPEQEQAAWLFAAHAWLVQNEIWGGSGRPEARQREQDARQRAEACR